MDWARISEIEIDHRIPINFGDSTLEEKITRLHHLNCQPLWLKDNRSKGSRYIGRPGEQLYELPAPLAPEPENITDDDLAELLGFAL